MKRLTTPAIISVLSLALSPAALASGYECESGPKDQWIEEEAVKVMLTEQGYEIRKIEVEDGCYEAYVKKEGKRFEVFVNPSTGEIEKVQED